VTLDYNVLEPTSSLVPAKGVVFDLVPKVTVDNERTFFLNVVAARVDGKVGGMTTINVSLFT
jgi:hypothetical protein